MDALGSDAAIEAADIVLMDDNPLKISKAIKISCKTLKVIKKYFLAILIKIAMLILGAVGIASMWEAVFVGVGVSLVAILNALRCMRK